MEYIYKSVMSMVLLFLISQVDGQCNMENRIKHRDEGVIVTSRENPCELVITSPDDRQMVAVFYNMAADCRDRGDIQIFDGNTTNSMIRSFCEANPSSYASRLNALIIRLLSSYKPFDLDIHLRSTTQTLPLNGSRFVSPVYQGFISNIKTDTTPNNFRATYTISAAENVTMELTFNKFDLFYTPICGDKVQIMPSSKSYCGVPDRNYKPSPALFVTNRLQLVFTTDAKFTYTGIDITYKVCLIKVSDTSGSLLFPIQSNNEITCVFQFSFDGQRNITLKEMNFMQGCTNNHQIFVEGVDRTSKVLGDCSSKSYSIIGNDVKIRFTSTQGGTFSSGLYEISIPMTTASSETSTYPNQGVTTPNNYTQDQNGADSEGLTSSSTQTAPIIAGVTVAVVVVVVVVAVVSIIVIRRKRRQQATSATYNNKSNDVQIYSDNDNYDVLGKPREKSHNSADKNKNIYGTTGTAVSEYSSFNRNGQQDTGNSTSEYDVSKFGDTYDEMNRGDKKKTDTENIYE